MTTREAAIRYEAEHVSTWKGTPVEVFNPHSMDVNELPIIYGFNNGHWSDVVAQNAQLIAEDGTPLGGHGCSSEAYMPSDLGILEGSCPSRHEEDFKPHYPDGYRMMFVPGNPREHDGLARAIKLNNEMKTKPEPAKLET